MTAAFEIEGTDITIRMEWANSVDIIQRIVLNASSYLFDKGFGNHGTDEEPREFSDLSNQEQLDLVYNHFTTVAINLANTWVSTEAQRVARDATIPHEL